MGLSAPGTEALVEFCRMDSSKREWNDQLRGILEVTASTGKVWHEWEFLKQLLAFRLDQVLSDYNKLRYPSGGGEGPPRALSTGESFEELRGRLHHSLSEFTDGAPFTIQRLSEVLLDPASTYPTLEKVALAIEKLLSVTSTIRVSQHPFPLSPPSSLPTARGVGEEGGVCSRPIPPSSAADGFRGSADVDANAAASVSPTTTILAVAQGLQCLPHHQGLVISDSTEASLANAVLTSSTISSPSSASGISEAMASTSSLEADQVHQGDCTPTPPPSPPPVAVTVSEDCRSALTTSAAGEDSPSEEQIMASLLETGLSEGMQVVSGESGNLSTSLPASSPPPPPAVPASSEGSSNPVIENMVSTTDDNHIDVPDVAASDVDGVSPMESDSGEGGGKEDRPPSPLPPPTLPPAHPQGEETKEEVLPPASDRREGKGVAMGSGDSAADRREENVDNMMSEEEEAQYLQETRTNVAGTDLVDSTVENMLKADTSAHGINDSSADVDMVEAADR